MDRMLQTFQSDLESLRKQHEELKARIEQSRVTTENTAAPEDLITTDVGAETVFQVLGEGTVGQESSASYTTTTIPEGTPQSLRTTSIFGKQTVTPAVRIGGIFKSGSEAGPKVTLPQEEQASIQGSTEGLVAPPSTPTSGFLPMVQSTLEPPSPQPLSVSTATQAPTSEAAYSETLEVIPEAIQAPLVTEITPKVPKTYLIPWDMNAAPEYLFEIVQWILRTVFEPDDYVKILISGELQGEETREGEISHLIGNEVFTKNKKQLQAQFPLLVQVIETSGLEKVPFQIEIRRNESLGWSLRSEFQWPHMQEQLVVVVPSLGPEHPGFEQFVLSVAPCPVIECPLR